MNRHPACVRCGALSFVLGVSLAVAPGSVADDEGCQGGMFRVAPPRSLPIFDPRLLDDFIRYSPIDGRVFLEGDIDLGTVEDVLRNSWSLAISAARRARDDEKLMQGLDPAARERIRTLAGRTREQLRIADLAQAREDVRDAGEALRPLQELRLGEGAPEDVRREAAVIFAGASNEFRWPGGIIPCELDDRFKEPAMASQTERIARAVAHWSRRTDHVRFVALDPRRRDRLRSWVKFVPTKDACFSQFIGRNPLGGEQQIGLSPRCGVPQIIHEMGHVVGLFHEQNRNDRDRYLTILWDNLCPDARGQFLKIRWAGEDVGPFDFTSPMLYPYKAFSANGKPTMVRKGGQDNTRWGIGTGSAGGSATELSAGDIRGIERMYPDVARASDAL